MSPQSAMSLLSGLEFVLWVAFAYLFWRRKLHRQFPAMGAYLALHVAAMPVLLFLFYGLPLHWFNDYCHLIYFLAFWAVYIASAVLLFFVCIELFCSALSGFSGLQRLSIVAFRWAALVSAIVSLSTVSEEHPHILLIPSIAYGLDAYGEHPRTLPAGFPLPEHECLAPSGSRYGIRDRPGLWPHVFQRIPIVLLIGHPTLH